MREMVNCGVPWIGEIPKGWMVRRIKTLFSERTELSETGNETLMSVSEYYGVDSRASHIEEDEHLSRSESLIGYKKCYPGDIVSNIMLAWKGSLGVARQAGIVSPAYCVYMPATEVFPMYYHYLFRTSLYTWQFKCYSKGIIDSRLRLYSPFFYDIPALIPPVTEQRRIAEFLDSKCVEIDSISEKTRASIEEYKKLKQSVITEAVTKGIRGNRPMKYSGVEWIGEIPAEWRVCKMKHAISVLAGYAFSSDSFTDQGVRLLRGINVTPQGLRWEETVYWNQSIDSSIEAYQLRAGDLVLGLDRPWIKEGTRVTFVNETDLPCLLLQRVCRIRPRKTSDIRFVFWVIASNLFEEALTTDTTGISIPHISTGQLEAFIFAIPSLSEQQEIAAYLDEKCAAIDSLIASKEALITELESYKKSLIYEYVTGKKEVPAV